MRISIGSNTYEANEYQAPVRNQLERWKAQDYYMVTVSSVTNDLIVIDLTMSDELPFKGTYRPFGNGMWFKMDIPVIMNYLKALTKEA